MLFAVLFTDDPDHIEARQREMPAHLRFLEKNSDRIRGAGPLRDGDDPSFSGGLWLVEAADRAAVLALCREDPFWPTGLRKDLRVCEWIQVFAEGRRRI
jgi:uncharacterized protein YciI